MNELLRFEEHRGVAAIGFDNPPVNALNAVMRERLGVALESALADDAVKGIVIRGAGHCFSGGADITELGRPERNLPPQLPELIALVEAATKPVVAVIQGFALGSGFEIALGCHYRIAARGARVGLPEVKLGLMPGAGGTQRLPRIIGIESALDVILSGESIIGEDALALGIFDRIAQADLLEDAIAFAREVAASPDPLPRLRDREVRLPKGRSPESIFARTRARIEGRARGLIAPWHCIESVRHSLTTSFDEALRRERALSIECRESRQSKAQRHLFFAERQAARRPEMAREVPGREIRAAGVVGCGTIGVGIVMSFANASIPVSVLEASPESLERGLAAVRAGYEDAAAHGRITRPEVEHRLSLITPVLDYSEIREADLVVEAVVEDLETKLTAFRLLDASCHPDAIFTTTTTWLSIEQLAGVTTRPDRFIGTHFYNPANVIKLTEVVRTTQTSDQTIARVMALCKRLGKAGVLVRAREGLVGNRMYQVILRQAALLLEEGALPQQVDRVAYEFGFPMGPFLVSDLMGLEVSWRIRQRAGVEELAVRHHSPLAKRLYELGRVGQAEGAGWYRYDDERRMAFPDPEVEDLIMERSEELGIERRRIEDREIMERCMFASINEGGKILDEGLAQRPSDIDVICVYGFGFPAHRGGPMYYADRIGLRSVYDALRRYQEHLGDLMAPCALIERLVQAGKRLYN